MFYPSGFPGQELRAQHSARPRPNRLRKTVVATSRAIVTILRGDPLLADQHARGAALHIASGSLGRLGFPSNYEGSGMPQ